MEEEVNIGGTLFNKSAGISGNSVSVYILSVGRNNVHLCTVGNDLGVNCNITGLGPYTCRTLVAGVGVGSSLNTLTALVIYRNSVFVKVNG